MITGASGNIGKKLQANWQGRYTLRLLDRHQSENEAVALIDLSNWSDSIVQHFQGADVIVHLAADPYDTKSWKELIAPNLDTLCNVFLAAMKARVPRVIFASSNHVMGGYKNDAGSGRWLTTELDPKPGTNYESSLYDSSSEDNETSQCLSSRANGESPRLNSTPYAAMKLFGERLARSYASACDAVAIAIRIGWVYREGDNRPEDLPPEADLWFKRMWLSTADMTQLIEQAIAVPLPAKTFLVVNGMSDNENMVWDIENTRSILGYKPADGLKL